MVRLLRRLPGILSRAAALHGGIGGIFILESLGSSTLCVSGQADDGGLVSSGRSALEEYQRTVPALSSRWRALSLLCYCAASWGWPALLHEVASPSICSDMEKLHLVRAQMGALFAVFWFMRRKMGGAESPGSRIGHVATLAVFRARPCGQVLLRRR